MLPSTSRLRSWRRRLASAEPPTNASFGAVQIPGPFPFPAAHCAPRSALPQLRSPLLAVSLLVVSWWWSPSVSVSVSLGIHSHRSQRSLASLAVAQEQEPPSVLGTPAPRLEGGWGRRTVDGGEERGERGRYLPKPQTKLHTHPSADPGCYLANKLEHDRQPCCTARSAPLTTSPLRPSHCVVSLRNCVRRTPTRPQASCCSGYHGAVLVCACYWRDAQAPQGRARSDPAGTWCQHPHPHTAHSPRAASEFRAAANCELLLTWPLACRLGPGQSAHSALKRLPLPCMCVK